MAMNFEITNNNIIDLTDDEKASITATLQDIQSKFVAIPEQPVCDTFFLLVQYNATKPDVIINGATVEALLTPPLDPSGV